MVKTQTDQTNARTLHAEGMHLLQKGIGDAAVRNLQAAASATPSAEYFSDLALAQQKCGHIGRALHTLRLAVRTFPEAQPPRCTLARLLAAQNHAAEALSLLDEIPEQIRQADSHLTRGLMLYKLARRKDATAAFERAHDMAPENLALCHMLAKCYNEEKNWTATLTVLAEAEAIVARSPGETLSPQHYLMQGWAGMHLHNSTMAIRSLKQALKLYPAFDTAEELQGKLCTENFDLAGALTHFNNLSARHPQEARYHDYAGHILTLQQQYEDAITRLKTAIRLAPENVSAACHLAEALISSNHHPEAQTYLTTLGARFPDNDGVWLTIGDCQLIAGNLGAAQLSYEKVRKLNPHLSGVYRRILSAGGALPYTDGLRIKLEAELKSPDHDAAGRSDLHIALAHLCEQEKDYPAALKHLNHGNALKRKNTTYDEAGWLDRMDRLQTPGWSAPVAEVPVRAPRILFVVGMPRSGTTLVEQILASHSAVYGAGERPEIFQMMQQMLPTGTLKWQELDEEQFYRLGAEYRKRVVPLAPDVTWIVDKLPANGMFSGPILRALPDAKIIWVERDVMDCAFSCYRNMFAGNLPYAYDQAELGRFTRHFLQLMQFWKSTLPAERFLHLPYEDLVTTPEEKIREILSFCDLEWQDACLHFEKTKRAVRTASAAQVRKPLDKNTGGRWKPYAEGLSTLQAALNGEIPIPQGTDIPCGLRPGARPAVMRYAYPAGGNHGRGTTICRYQQ